MNKYTLQSESTSLKSVCHGRVSITAGGGWYYNGGREYTKIYVLGRTKAFLPFNVVCLDVREIAGAQIWCTGIMLVHACVCARKVTHTFTHTHACTHTHKSTFHLEEGESEGSRNSATKQM